MNRIIKKWFPKYKTKADLEKEIAFLQGASMMRGGVIEVKRDVIQLRAFAEIDKLGISPPTEYIKEMLCHNMVREIMPHVEFDISDSPGGGKYLIGRIFLAKRK